MKTLLTLILSTYSIMAVAHEGHGVDAGSAIHFLSGAHIWPLGLVILATGFALWLRAKQRR